MLLSALLLLLLLCDVAWQHARMMEPPSRASAWRVGFPTPKNENDNEVYCGGYGVQHDQNGGRCGICGDPWDAFPRKHEAPGGIYATGIITRTYKQGSIIPVVIDISANHQGYFEFKLCPNNDIWQDPEQDCFDRFVLKTGKKGSVKHPINDYTTGLRIVYVRLPTKVNCEQCILQWSYVAGNNWGICPDGTGAMGCGPQETFRACSDIRIVRDGSSPLLLTAGHSSSTTTTPSSHFTLQQQISNSLGHVSPTTSTVATRLTSLGAIFDLADFEDYYDDLFGGGDNTVDQQDLDRDRKAASHVLEAETKKLELMKRKLELSTALTSLRSMIMLSDLKANEERRPDPTNDDIEDRDGAASGAWETTGSTVLPWWARTNSHGKKKRRRRRKVPTHMLLSSLF